MNGYKDSNLTKMDKTIDEILESLGDMNGIQNYGSGTVSSAIIHVKSYVDTKIANLVGTAPETLDTLQEIANMFSTHGNIMNSLSATIGTKAPISHAVNANTYGLGTPDVYGHVKLSDEYGRSIGNSWNSVGASQSALYSAYNDLNNRKLNLSGGTMSGTITFPVLHGVHGWLNINDGWRIIGLQTGDDNGELEIATSDNGTEPIVVRQYMGDFGTFGNSVRTAVLLDGQGNTSFPGSVMSWRDDGVEAWVGSHNHFGQVRLVANGDGDVGLHRDATAGCGEYGWIIRDSPSDVAPMMSRLHITANNDVNMSSTWHGLTIGTLDQWHLAIDGNGIMARSRAGYNGDSNVYYTKILNAAGGVEWIPHTTTNAETGIGFAFNSFCINTNGGDVAIGNASTFKAPYDPWKINLSSYVVCEQDMHVKGTLSAIKTDFSDENLKNIMHIDERYEQFFDMLEPIVYTLKYEGDEKYIGFGARAVEQAMISSGLSLTELSCITKKQNYTYEYTDPKTGKEKSMKFDEIYMLTYKEFIGLAIHMIKKNQRKITELETTVSELQSTVEKLIELINQ